MIVHATESGVHQRHKDFFSAVDETTRPTGTRVSDVPPVTPLELSLIAD